MRNQSDPNMVSHMGSAASCRNFTPRAAVRADKGDSWGESAVARVRDSEGELTVLQIKLAP